jgi:hypothetical protein
MKKEFSQKAEQFAKENWPEIFAGTGVVASAVILLLVRYYKSRRTESDSVVEVPDLNVIEGEALSTGIDEVPMLLETGTYAVDSIPDGDNIANGLAKGLTGRAKEVMETLGKLRRKK